MINLHLDTDILTLSEEKAKKKIDDINYIAGHFYTIKNYEVSEYCAKAALDLSVKIQYKKGTGEAKYNLSMISFHEEDYPASIQNLIEAEKLFEGIKDEKNLAKVCYQIGLTYWNVGDYSNEIESFFKSLTFYRQIGNLNKEANCLNSIGNYYLEVGDLDTGLEYHRMSLNIKRKIKDVRGIIFSLYNIALINNNIAALRIPDDNEKKMEYYKKSLKYYSEALEFNNKLEKDTFLENRILQNMGLIYISVFEHDKAVAMLTKCIEYFESTSNDIDKCDTLIYLGIGYTKVKQWEKAEEIFFSALKIAEGFQTQRHILNLHRYLAEMYKSKEDFRSGLNYLKNYAKLESERAHTLLDSNLRKLSVLHKVDITKKEMEVLTGKNENLISLNEELIKLNSEKNHFLQLAAIDLKLPLKKIGDKISILKNSSRETKFNYLSEILEESAQMQKIISGLLTVNESQSAK